MRFLFISGAAGLLGSDRMARGWAPLHTRCGCTFIGMEGGSWPGSSTPGPGAVCT